ncbi:MAG: hypothetical protein ACRC1D_03440 [Culicoidibacterales bacterium]
MDGQQQMRKLFGEFKQLHPNNEDQFNPSLDNLLRWQHAIGLAKERQSLQTTPFDLPNDTIAKKIAAKRAITDFQDFPELVKNKYWDLAFLFPNRHVYAVGSRVTGEWIDKDSGSEIIEMRKDLMKKETDESDYDFTLDYKECDDIDLIRSKTPRGFDFLQILSDEEPKILIPMWDFTKIPKDRINEVIDLVEGGQWGALMDIHNEYQLSPQTLCCNSDPARKWFTWAVQNKIIERQ